MPLIRIDVLTTWSDDDVAKLGDAVQTALVESLGVPQRDRFQVITRHEPGSFVFDRSYLDIERSDRFVMVQVTLSAGRTTEAKQAFYRQLADLLEASVGLSPNDLAVSLIENTREDWSFGRGEASYVVLPKEQWR